MENFPLFFLASMFILFATPYSHTHSPLSNLFPKVEEMEIRGSDVVSKLDKNNTQSTKRSTKSLAGDKEIANHNPNTLRRERNLVAL